MVEHQTYGFLLPTCMVMNAVLGVLCGSREGEGVKEI